MGEHIFYTFLNSPFGKIGIASSSSGIVYVGIGKREDNFLEILKRRFGGNSKKSEEKNNQAINELNSYLEGNLKVFSSRLDTRGTPFQLAAWSNTRKIPYGHIRSYKSIASATGNPNSYRAVGNAMAQNPIPIFIPCHRVIKSDGSLGNYGPGKDIKRKLLEMEGAI
jgi:O-6-methylguanine DNA methyltransferase